MSGKCLHTLEFRHRNPAKKREAKTIIRPNMRKIWKIKKIARLREKQIVCNQY